MSKFALAVMMVTLSGANALAQPTPAPPPTLTPEQSAFRADAGAFISCLKATVQMGMMAKVEPSRFQAVLDSSCRAEEARFRASAIKVAMQNGRTAEAAAAEVDGNIANGRRIFAHDEATFMETGEVPHH